MMLKSDYVKKVSDYITLLLENMYPGCDHTLSHTFWQDGDFQIQIFSSIKEEDISPSIYVRVERFLIYHHSKNYIIKGNRYIKHESNVSRDLLGEDWSETEKYIRFQDRILGVFKGNRTSEYFKQEYDLLEENIYQKLTKRSTFWHYDRRKINKQKM